MDNMDDEQKAVVQQALNSISMQPVTNMQQLVSHWTTVMVHENTETKKRGRATQQTPVSELSNANDRTKRRILTRP
jgi:hypothetical protein|tara:strand:+ start:133 stop:360 length:228 start_codon:yes stop_codon:yes gene_type:complete